ncbi:hypothetical protein [Blastochloris sulfoviridis]|uniref:Uncharacterized protein n=1 Tax=Blastochloris sulfoviridis TaxID=50712 RepID=A0A5M6I2S3_9HYPH|nr:hypothetical protein [Blastochloris sulfoviridis]KAA5602472.1 hypothetical protein F1193_04695 [Blastochloris sulfoviridis]
MNDVTLQEFMCTVRGRVAELIGQHGPQARAVALENRRQSVADARQHRFWSAVVRKLDQRRRV